MSRWYYELPYGPLTLENFDKLALALYDDTDREVQRIAEQRGIDRGAYIRARLGKMVADSQAEVTEIQSEDVENA